MSYDSTERRIFLHMISQASAKGWRLDHAKARELVDLGIGLNMIDPENASTMMHELEFGHVFLRDDGHWACTTCGGNCGQCGMTSVYGNIGFSIDHLAQTEQGRHSLPVYRVKGRRLTSVLALWAGIIVALCLILLGCTHTCAACVGPYDITLNSHREALQ